MIRTRSSFRVDVTYFCQSVCFLRYQYTPHGLDKQQRRWHRAMWKCSDNACGALNGEDVYRCHFCDSVKPYNMSPVYADPTSSDSPLSSFTELVVEEGSPQGEWMSQGVGRRQGEGNAPGEGRAQGEERAPGRVQGEGRPQGRAPGEGRVQGEGRPQGRAQGEGREPGRPQGEWRPQGEGRSQGRAQGEWRPQGEWRAQSPPAVSQRRAAEMVEMTPMRPNQDSAWGGARPKAPATRRGMLGTDSPTSADEDRRPLMSEQAADCSGAQSEGRPPRYDRGQNQQYTPVARAGYESEQVLGFPDSECRLILIGRTGNGKSSAGNTLLGMAKFLESGGFSSETTTCQMYRAERFGIPVEVVDTPGFFDTNTPEEQLVNDIRSCIGMVSPGPHAIALVIGGRFTAEQVETVEHVRAVFGSKVMGHMLVIFTFGDMLSRGQGEGRCEDVIEEKLEKAPQELRKLIKEDLDNRYVVFNNNGTLREKERQVRALLLMVRRILHNNKNRSFSAPLLEKCENAVRDYEARVLALLNSNDPVTRQQIRRVFRKLMDKDENTQQVLEEVLKTQADATLVREDLEETKNIMGAMIRQHKQNTDELIHRLKCRRCVLL
ncbi:hypothetical protein ACOMHN_043279 [Nucella lapillus]